MFLFCLCFGCVLFVLDLGLVGCLFLFGFICGLFGFVFGVGVCLVYTRLVVSCLFLIFVFFYYMMLVDWFCGWLGLYGLVGFGFGVCYWLVGCWVDVVWVGGLIGDVGFGLCV